METSRRSLIQGIGAAICVGITPTFVRAALPPEVLSLSLVDEFCPKNKVFLVPKGIQKVSNPNFGDYLKMMSGRVYNDLSEDSPIWDNILKKQSTVYNPERTLRWKVADGH